MRPKLNKWTIELRVFKRPEYLDGRHTLIFGIYNLLSYPPEGVRITKENYKGFRLIYTMLFKVGW